MRGKRTIPRTTQADELAPKVESTDVSEEVSATVGTRPNVNPNKLPSAWNAVPGDANRFERFPQLDGLRGAAAIGVVFIHYLDVTAGHIPALSWFFRFLVVTPLSLDIFFVLSGFLIGGILLKTKEEPGYYGNFYKRRFARIMPVYYAWLSLFVVLYFACQGWGLEPPNYHSGAFYLLSFALFFQNFFPSVIESSFIMAPTWTLAVEEHFYLLVPVAIRKLSRRGLVRAMIGIIVFAPIFRGVLDKYIGHHAEWADIASRIWTLCRADALAMGVLLALAWSDEGMRSWVKAHLKIFLWGIPTATGLAAFLAWAHLKDLHHGHFADVAFGRTAVEISSLGAIVYLICRPETWAGRFLSSKTMRHFGKISYCLYIVHWGVNWMVFRFVLHARFGDHLWLDVAVAPVSFLLSVGLAQLSWVYFERPILRRGRNRAETQVLNALRDGRPQAA
jgi:peptidoglycan/LPS O-acetylase OafA/YrhL